MPNNDPTGHFDPPDSEATLGEVIAAYLRSVESGQPISRDSLIEQHPELADDLAEFVANHECVERLSQPLRALTPASEPAAQLSVKVRYFGDYELLEQIAQGGMGIVYKARQISLNRLVAVKMIRSGLLATDADVKRFAAEAEAAANLRHPGIVAIYEVGVCEGQHYYSMEYVEGRDLSQIVRDNPLSHDKAAAYVQQMAEIVEFSHSQGVLHRDLKPANVLIDAADRVRITDFGLAKRVGSDSDLTTSGQVIGTPKYMSPEQAAAQHALIGPASDVYALGSILYELLTGRAPFRSDSAIDILRQIQQDDPVRPKLLNARLPKDLETICLKCLEKEPRRRYASAQDLADELTRFLRGEPIRARPIGRSARALRWCKRKPVMAGLLAALVIGTAGTTWQAIRATLAEQATLLALADVSAENNRANANEARAIELARKEITARRNSQFRAARLMLEQAWSKYERQESASAVLIMARILVTLESLDHADRRRPPTPSLQSSALATFIRKHVLRSAVRGQIPRACIPQKEVICLALSPDGRHLVTGCADHSARLWDVVTGLQVVADLRHPDRVERVVFSPNGTKLATGCKDDVARVWDLATSQLLHDSFRHGSSIAAIAFSPDGSKLLTAARDNSARQWDVETGNAIADELEYGPSQPSFVRMRRIGEDGVSGPTEEVALPGPQLNPIFSPDGTKLAVNSFNSATLWDLKKRERLGEIKHDRPITSVNFTPDGSQLATGDSRTIKLWDAANPKSPLRTTSIGQGGRFVSWESPFIPNQTKAKALSWDATAVWDLNISEQFGNSSRHPHLTARSSGGDMLATAAWDQCVRLWAVNVLHSPTEILAHSRPVIAAAFSPDNTTLATGCYDNAAHLWNIRTGEPIGSPLKHTDEVWTLAFSPDGKWLATASADRTARIWKVDTREPISTLHHSSPVRFLAYSPDGKTLATGAANAAQLWNAATGQPLGGALVHDDGIRAMAFSPDGTKLATASRDHTARLWAVTSGKQLGYALKHSDEVLAAMFCQDSSRLVTISADRVLRVWNVATGEPVGNVIEHSDDIVAMDFNVDSTYLATVSGNALRRWDVSTGQVPEDALEFQDGLLTANFNSKCSLVATVSGSKAQVWDVTIGKPLGGPLYHADSVVAVAFSPDGSKLATVSDDCSVRLWDIDAQIVESAAHVQLWVETLTGATVSDAGVLRHLTAHELIAKQEALRKAGGPPRAYLEALEKQRENRNMP